MISVTILTKNSEQTLQATLESTASFPEVFIFDTGSTDATLSIAEAFSNVRIHRGEFQGFGSAHRQATALASFDWILSIDSDEVLSPALIEEIHTLDKNPCFVYAIERHNYFNGKRILGCAGWHPDWVRRLYHRTRTDFSEEPVHEKVLLQGLQEVRLKSPLYHTPYRQIGDFLEKMQSYTTLFAAQHRMQKHSSVLKALLRSWLAFLKSYFFKRGFLAGEEGLIISLYNAHTTFYKYLKLLEKNKMN
jgi:glycosyltransferase involved in cell wall biosynthesis